MVDSNFIFIDEVSCSSSETALLNCFHIVRGRDGYFCSIAGDAGVRCREEELRVKSVSASESATQSYSNYTKQSVMISWELYSTSSHRPSSFRVECFDLIHQHHMELSLNNGTLLQINMGDLLSSTSFACCVSAIFYEKYETERRCYATSSELLPDLVTSLTPNQTLNQVFMTYTLTHSTIPSSIGSDSEKVCQCSDLNVRTTPSVIIGGVLGPIILVLLILLVILCGRALLQSRDVTAKR